MAASIELLGIVRNRMWLRMVVAAAMAAGMLRAGAQTAPAVVPVPMATALVGDGAAPLAANACASGLPTTVLDYYSDGCPASTGQLSSPQGAAVDKYGNVYVADYSDRLVRVVYNGGAAVAAMITAANSGYAISATRNAPAPAPQVGYIYTIAGVGGGTGAGSFAALTNTAGDGKFVCANYAATGQPEALNLLGDGCPAASAPIGPRDVTVDAEGNLFLTDYTDNRIRVLCVNCAANTMAAQLIALGNPGVTPVNGAMYTVAGFTNGYRDGYPGYIAAANVTGATAAMGISLLRSPTVAVVSANDDIFIADNLNNAVRVLYNGGTAAKNILVAQGQTPQVGYVYTIAGADCVSAALNKLGTTTSANSCLVTTPGGAGYPATADTAAIGNNTPVSVAWTVYLDPNGNVYYSDAGNVRLKVIYGGIAPPVTFPTTAYPTLQSGYSYSFAGQGTLTASGVAPSQLALSSPQGVGGDASGNIFFMDYNTALFYETYAQNGLTAIIGGGNAITTASTGAVCSGGTAGPTMTDAFYNGCPLTQVKMSGTRGPLVSDGNGNLYFGDSTGYFVRKFSYNTRFPATAVGATSAAQAYAFTFISGKTLTASSFLTDGSAGTSFSDAGNDTCTTGLVGTGGGPGTTCVVNVTFSPQQPGVSSGAVELNSVAGVLGESLLSGTGTGAALTIDPSTLTTTGSGLAPVGIAVEDEGARVLVSDAASKSVVRYVAGVGTTIATGFTAPGSVAVDGSDDIYVADTSVNTITEIPVTGTKFVLSSAVSNPGQLTTDGYGNLYVADTGNNRVVMFGAGFGSSGAMPVVVGFSGITAPVGVAVDAAGNVYEGDAAGIHKLTAAGVQSTISSSATGAIALDAAGDVVAVQGTTLQMYSSGGSPAVTVATGLITPKSVVMDPLGNVYLADKGVPGYQLYARTAGYYKYPSSPASTTVSLTSSGNLSLTAPNYSTQSDSTDFSVTAATTNPCSGSMGAGVNCNLTAAFTPAVAGTLVDSITITSNAANAPTSLTLTGTTAAQTTSTSFAVGASTLVYGNVETLTATVTGSLTTPGDGTVNFYNGATLLGTTTVGTGGVGTLNLVPAVGTYATVTAVYVPNGLTYLGSTSSAKSFTVTPAVLTVTANNASKVSGAANPALTYTITGFVNSDTQTVAVTGTPIESTTAITTSPVGTYPITITQGSLVAANYTFSFINGTLTITGSTAQTITFSALPGVTYGAATITLGATASSGLTVSYTVTGPASVSGSTLTVTGAGTVAVTANQNGNNTYAAATPVTQSFSVTKGTLTVAATNASKVYGATNPNLTYTATGFVNSDSQVTATSGAPTESTATTVGSGVGTYPITIAAGTLASNNYVFAFTDGTLTVTPATLTVTANSASRSYGTANPTFTGTMAGAVNGDVLTETFTTTATVSSPVGTYPIVPGASGANAGNYTLSATNGTLTITQVKPTVLLTVSPNTGFSGATTITLTATLTTTVTGVPTGTVTFYAGTTSVGTGTVNGSGVAVLTTTNLPVGTDCVTAAYAGDTNFGTITSSCVTATIAAGFSVTPTSTALSFQPNYQEAQAYLSINPGGRTDTLTFTCNGLPAKLSCAFTPATLSLSGISATQTVQMLVSNSGAKAQLNKPPSHSTSERIAAFAVLPFAWLLFGIRRRKIKALLLPVFLLLAAITVLSGCGNSTSSITQNSGTYPFTVTVTGSGTTLQTLNFTLTIP